MRLYEIRQWLLAALVICATMSAGCGTGRNSQAERERRNFEVDEVIGHFRASTGDSLRIKGRFPGNEVVGPFSTLSLPGAYASKYGVFEIAVHDDIERARSDGLLGGLTPNGEGIYWQKNRSEREDEADMWSATKLYANVQLIWWAERRQIDSRWRRLDNVLSRLK